MRGSSSVAPAHAAPTFEDADTVDPALAAPARHLTSSSLFQQFQHIKQVACQPLKTDHFVDLKEHFLTMATM
ncbi:hypothetical protein [Burkholderia seminalis]|uniref:hypothetical protein n=1 Tax=Burkholderia seminalis TaxID=488731 RepID=UPI000A3FF1D0|nr:hypothetical protein [Burkholderia seminalis]MCA8042100.1 hypothetical protein [Burkholderia seminalis]MCA8432351.1 hypothetical protein [Burkholderia seminalis]MDN7852486.1 hypothetical protein [Burkholderia seminalis]